MADHNQRLKSALRECVAEYLALAVPEWADRFDLTAPEWLEQELFPDPPEGERRQIDLVARGGLRRQVGEATSALLHIEVESQDSLTSLRVRMPRYHDFLAYKHGLPVLSMGLYLSVALDGRGWDEVREELWDETLGTTRWPYLGLPGLNALTYVEGENVLGVALSVMMRASENEQPRLKARAMQRLAEANLTPLRRFLLMSIVEAYLPLHGPHLEEYQAILKTKEFEMGRVLAKTSYELGEESGLSKGQRAMLRHQLERRFGPLSEAVVARLEAWPADKLLQLGDDLLTAKSLAELGLEDAGS